MLCRVAHCASILYHSIVCCACVYLGVCMVFFAWKLCTSAAPAWQHFIWNRSKLVVALGFRLNCSPYNSTYILYAYIQNTAQAHSLSQTDPKTRLNANARLKYQVHATIKSRIYTHNFHTNDSQSAHRSRVVYGSQRCSRMFVCVCVCVYTVHVRTTWWYVWYCQACLFIMFAYARLGSALVQLGVNYGGTCAPQQKLLLSIEKRIRHKTHAHYVHHSIIVRGQPRTLQVHIVNTVSHRNKYAALIMLRVSSSVAKAAMKKRHVATDIAMICIIYTKRYQRLRWAFRMNAKREKRDVKAINLGKRQRGANIIH